MKGMSTEDLRIAVECKYHRDATPNLSEERWESKFRWTVLRDSIETVRD